MTLFATTGRSFFTTREISLTLIVVFQCHEVQPIPSLCFTLAMCPPPRLAIWVGVQRRFLLLFVCFFLRRRLIVYDFPNKDNFAQKAGAFKACAELGVAIVMPETRFVVVGNLNCKQTNKQTSPPFFSTREDVPGDSESWDLGKGAGFYVDATQEPWKKNYQNYTYVTSELLAVLKQNFLDRIDFERVSIFGHSMGGHGALVAALKNPGKFRSVSAFAPICRPTACGWGSKAFQAYLGSVQAGEAYDATLLVKDYAGPKLPILITQGSGDKFLVEQLRPLDFVSCAMMEQEKFDLCFQLVPGYDHSYYFISTFIEEHIRFHVKHLVGCLRV